MTSRQQGQTRRDTHTSESGDSFRVVVAGGGIAALEAILALRELLGRRPEVDLVAPNRELVRRALAVGEPFGAGEVRRVPLDRLAADIGFQRHEDLLASVEPDRSTVVTAGGRELGYDALLVALGARAETALPGALTYSGPESNQGLREILESLRAGEACRLVFAVPPLARWSLPLYELAVLTARYARREKLDADLVLATHEAEPLELFGSRASEGVRQLLAIEGIELRTSAAPTAVRGGALRLASGEALAADAVIALPRFAAPRIPGLPQGPDGFVGTDTFMRVEGLGRVWAAGDITWFPIKQGGLAAQQADVAARGIAHILDPAIETTPFTPVLRGALMTGWMPHYLRAPAADPTQGSAPTTAPLWWPPSKIAGRLLGPYLAGRDGGEPVTLEDLGSSQEADQPGREEDHRDWIELALTAADLDAQGGDYAAALRWLEVAERLNLTLPYAYAERRRRWRSGLPTEAEPVVAADG